jgi:hypothetical protein
MQFERGKPPETPNAPYRAARIKDQRWRSAGPRVESGRAGPRLNLTSSQDLLTFKVLAVSCSEPVGLGMQVEVFRRLYEMVGLGWVYAITKVPGIGGAADAVYDLWAKYRLPITGRPDLLEVVKRRSQDANCREERVAQAAAAVREK